MNMNIKKTLSFILSIALVAGLVYVGNLKDSPAIILAENMADTQEEDSHGTYILAATGSDASGGHDTATDSQATGITITYQIKDEDASKGTLTTPEGATGQITGATITPNPGYYFVKWTNDVDTTKEFTDATLTVEQVESVAKVNGAYRNVVFTANFATDTQVTIEYSSATVGGSVAKTSDVFWARTGSPEGTTAVPSYGYIFNVWTNNQTDDTTTFSTPTLTKEQIDQIAKKADGTYKTGVKFTASFKVDPTRIILTYQNGNSSMGTISGTTDTVYTQSGTPAGSTATPLKGYRFVSWTYGSGTVATTSNALTKEIIEATAKSSGTYVATTYTANFEVDPAGVEMALTLSAGETTQGHVEVDGQSATSATIRSTATELSQSIVAVPSTGYIFDRWTYSRNGGTETDLSRNATLTTEDLNATKINGIYTDVTLTAHFVQGTDATITYTVSTAGGGTVSPTTETINAGGTHPQGSTATPDMGYAFSHWTDAAGNTISTAATLSGDIVANAAKDSSSGQYMASTYTAHFVEDSASIAYLYYASSDATMGTVTNSQDRVNVTTGGTIAGATANATTGYKFVNWTAGTTVVSSSPILTQTDIDRIAKASGQYTTTTFTANFTAQVTVTWTFVTEDIARGSVAGGERFELSLEEEQAVTSVGATAQAATGYLFDGWYDEAGNRVSTQASFVPTRVNGKNVSGTYTARFSSDPSYRVELKLTKTTDAKYAKVGDEITYTITLSNAGNKAANSVILADDLATGLEYVSATPAAQLISGVYTWGYDTDETINPGETRTYVVTVRVTDAATDTIQIGSVAASSTSSTGFAMGYHLSTSSLQVHRLGTVAYSATWEQVTQTPASEYREGVSGFVWGNVVEYDVKITNNSNLALTMDVTDDFSQTGAFGEVSVVRVTGATDGGGQGGTRNITIAAGATATIRYSAKVIANIDNYATPGSANAGFENVASITNLKATATLADGSTVVYTADGRDGSVAWVADTNPLADSSVSGRIQTRTMDMMATYKFVIAWADTVPTYRPNSVQVQLKRTDTGEVIEQRTLTAEDRTASDEWTTTFATVKAYEMAEGLATSSDATFAVGAAITYEAQVLSVIPDGYTASAVTSVGTTFTVTYSRPWTPRTISSSGVPTSSSGGSSSSSSSTAPAPAAGSSSANAGAYSSRLFTMGTDGSWRVGNTTTGQTTLTGIAAESTNSVRFVLNDGTFISNSWAQISKTEGGATTNSWYHFDGEGRVDAGWYIDSAGDWFYLSDTADDNLGRMNVGWHYESGDGRWYYLDSNGYMLKGWQQIDGQWYYFATGTPYETWQYNTLTRRWVYKNIPDDRPLGSMYVNEATPGGYLVDANGAMYDRQ